MRSLPRSAAAWAAPGSNRWRVSQGCNHPVRLVAVHQRGFVARPRGNGKFFNWVHADRVEARLNRAYQEVRQRDHRAAEAPRGESWIVADERSRQLAGVDTQRAALGL